MLKKINKNLLLGFIVPYLLIVMIVFIAQYISNTVVMTALKNNAVNIVENSFKSNIDVIEQNLVKVKETAAIVAQNTAGNLERVDRNSKKFYTELTAIKDELSSYYVGNGVVKDICVQNDVHNYLVDFEVAYSDRMRYYTTMVESESLTPEKLLEASESANGFSTENICYYPGRVRAIPFVYPTPIMKDRTGSVLVYIDEKELLLPMRDLLKKSGGLLQAFDDEGKSVFNDGNDKIVLTYDETQNLGSTRRYKGEKYYLFSTYGHTSRWKYVVSLPENYVLSGMRYYQLLSLMFNFLILIAGFAICLFFTVRKSRSYLELLDTLGIKPETFGVKSFVSKDEYNGLRQHISKIKDENQFLLAKGTQSVLRRLLNGQFEKEEDIVKELKNHKMELKCSEYLVMAVRYTNEMFHEGKPKNFEGFFIDRICQYIPGAMVCFTEKNMAAVLFSYSGEDLESFVKNCVERIENEIFAKFSTKTLIGIGNKVLGLNEISRSYEEACETVKYSFLMDGQHFYFYRELPQGDDYVYPIEVENALFKSVLESDFENARNVLQKIKEENFVKRQLCVSAIYELLAELRASIKKICRLQTEYLEFSQEDSSVNHFFEHAISFLYMICSDSEKDKENDSQSRGQKICREVRNYIELYYSKPDLSLDVIAEEFRVHPNYLSSLFKKHTGSNIMSYLDNTRIEKAAELLSSGKYTVNEVSASVGFANDGTFRRRFKKVKGVPPSTYLKY